MSFAVKKKHKMAKNLKRILLSQTDRAIRQLKKYEQSPSITVREARISFKRARTILSLLRKVIDKQASQHYNSIYRDLGRTLSAQRDAFVKEQTLEQYQSSVANVLTQKISAEDKQAVQAALASLYALRIELSDQTFGKKDFSVLRKATRKFYQRIKLAQKHAEVSKQVDEYHKWRKEVKHLYHIVSFMIPVCPKEYTPLKKELHTLIRLLGDDRDLTILRKDISRKNSGKDSQKQTQLLKKLANRQQALRQKATKLGSRITAENPSKFVDRMEHYWKNYRNSQG